ncbi:MAG: hypothetical protein L0220_01410 [Acidobacteria bacterium]|nr:hypothetical protein [Acidobacteriota bacterium]
MHTVEQRGGKCHVCVVKLANRERLRAGQARHRYIAIMTIAALIALSIFFIEMWRAG